jgi:short-subunit dehydrogenase
MGQNGRMQIEGKLALVTGASSGIGEATARALAALGARVILVARSADKLEAIVENIKAKGGSAHAMAADLANADEVARLAEAVRREIGIPDVLINNAGAGRWLSVMETSAEEARKMIELPYLAAFYATKAFLPEMLARKHGCIVNVTSPASFVAWPNATGYIAARQALKGFSDGLRLEVEPNGVTVSLVVLGTVESSYWEHNPGSRERVPRGFAPLTTSQAADAIIEAIERNKRLKIRPALFRMLFALEAMVPGIAMRR